MLYAYAYNDPVNFMDSTGEAPDWVMDRRNQAFLHAMNDCEGIGAQCAQVYIQAVEIGLIPYELAGAGAVIRLVKGAIQIGGKVVVRQATVTAMKGGRHARYMRQAQGLTDRQLRRSARSLRKRADEHKARLKDNGVARDYVDSKSGKGTWDDMTEEQRDQVRDFWRKESENYGDQADIAEDILRGRGVDL